MATEEQQSPEMARQVSRYLGAFVGTAIVVGEGVVGACEKSARAAMALFERQGATCAESASEDSEPVLEEITPVPAHEVKGDPAVAAESSSKGAAPGPSVGAAVRAKPKVKAAEPAVAEAKRKPKPKSSS